MSMIDFSRVRFCFGIAATILPTFTLGSVAFGGDWEKTLLIEKNFPMLCINAKAPPEKIISPLLYYNGIPANEFLIAKGDIEKIGLLLADTDRSLSQRGQQIKQSLIDAGYWKKFRRLSTDVGNFLIDGHKKASNFAVENSKGYTSQTDIKAGYFNLKDVLIRCVPKKKKSGGEKSLLLVRANPKDLVVDEKNDSKAFKKLDHAGITFQDNLSKGKSELIAKFTLGLSTSLPSRPYLFAQFEASTTVETKQEDDPDNPGQKIDVEETKRTETLSPGFLWDGGEWSKPFGFIGTGSWGGSLKTTIDFEHDAHYARGSLWAKPEFSFGPNSQGCHQSQSLGQLLKYSCDATVSVVLAHVFDAGTHPKLGTVNSDQFVGLAGGFAVKITPDGSLRDTLKGLYLNLKFQHMQVLSGRLEDQNRMEFGLGYTLTERENVALEFTYVKGENANSYLFEEQLKLQFGVKF